MKEVNGIDPDDQLLAEVSGNIGTLVDLLIPNDGDTTTVAFGGTPYTITNIGTYSYSDLTEETD